ncbi:MAG: hypothetical protein Q9217_004281 [Psora testacea]
MSGGTGPKVKQMPVWQQDAASENSTATIIGRDSVTSLPTDGRASLLEKASKFLKDPDIRDAPSEKKQSFLQSKGLSHSETEQLLSNNANSESTPPIASQDVQEDKDNNSTVESSSKTQPPIITYPEFLLHSRKPPPLVTLQRLITAGYIISGAATVVYGTSKYLVGPMIESLSSARHSLHEIAAANLATLNEKLEGNVSTIPANYNNSDEGVNLDVESVTSDGARLFLRTAGTQTSPHLSRSPSISSRSSSAAPVGYAASHSSRLSELCQSLGEIKPRDSIDDAVKRSLERLRGYLDGLPSRRPMQMGGLLLDGNSEDSTARMKAEIRGMKGVLLSAKNFPSSLTSR